MDINNILGSKGWAHAEPSKPGDDRLRRDDPILGRVSPRFPAMTTAELAWTNYRANRAIDAAENAWLVQDGDTPKLVLLFDVDTAMNLSLRKPRDWRRIRRGEPSEGNET